MAGLTNLQIEGTIFRIDYHDQEDMRPGGLELLPRIGGTETPWIEVAPDLVDGGFIDSASIEAAELEADEWYRRPDAFLVDAGIARRTDIVVIALVEIESPTLTRTWVISESPICSSACF